ncbi:MAG: hypothetical protein R3264_09470, partial [Anaerolineae bacterium]|nr:hypothetical protein [Anaerolineae bacterium]
MSTSTVPNAPQLTEPDRLVYWHLTRFLFPLAVTATVREVSNQFLNGGMARVPQATQTLAGFGLADGLTLFLA